MSRSRCLLATVMLALPTYADAAEICGNGLDDDADNLTDEGCFVAANICESPLSCHDTGMVSPVVGALHYSLPPDVSPRVPWGPSIGLRRFYLSMYAPGGAAPAYRKALGERWHHTYMTWLTKTGTPPSGKVVLHTNRGQDILATYSSTAGGWDNYNTFQAGYRSAQYLRQRTSSPNEFQLRLMTGETLVYNSSGKLIELWDMMQIPNKVALTYDGNGQVSTVTDASVKRRLLFGYTGTVLTSVAFQLFSSPVWTTQHTTSYAYTSGNMTSVTIGGSLAQTNIYSSNYLTQIQDAAANSIVSFTYSAATAGKINRIDTTHGMVGYDYNSSRAACSGKTVLYFNRGSAMSCSVDADCGAGLLCGGNTGAGATGVCFRGARCLTVSSPSEDVVTTVTALGPPSEPCEGACLQASQYVWTTGTGVLDLKAIQDAKEPTGIYTVKEIIAATGLPKRITYGDPDSDPTNANSLREVFLFYDDVNFPGKLTEIRRKSDISTQASSCNAVTTTGCARTVYHYNLDGKLDRLNQRGYQLDSSGLPATFPFDNETTFSFDAEGKGRLAQINGPLPGDDDVTVLEFWTSSDPLLNGFVQNYKRKKDTTTFLVDKTVTFDFWGNPTTVKDNNDVVSCHVFDAARGYLKEHRQTMAGQADCSTPNAADLTRSWTRDSALRLTKITSPDNSCLIYEYDTKGRLSKTKRRDDCLAASPGDREEYTYSPDGLLTKIETFDASSIVTKRQEMTYFDSLRLEKMINPVDVSKWTGLVYESRGLSSELNGGGNLSKTTWTYNNDGRVVTENRYTAGSSFDTWNLVFDWVANQRSVQDQQTMTTLSTRDDLERLTRLESPDLNGGVTVHLYDAASRRVLMKEALGGVGEKQHSFTFDNVQRPLVDDRGRICINNLGFPISISDIRRTYDAPPVACPIPGGCNRTNGRLAYVNVTLMCNSLDPDSSLDQETFYSYDDAGRVIREYIRDDTGRVADHVFTWTKNGALATVTTPSTAVIGWTYGSASNNSDTDLVTRIYRTSIATPIIDVALWFPYGPIKQYNQQNTISGLPERTRISRNLAYRITETRVEAQAGSPTLHAVLFLEDARGRVTKRDYYPSDPNIPGLHDSFFLYDLQDRVLCETTNFVSSCPTSGTNIKNSHSLSPPFTAAGDWKRILRPIPGSTGLTNNFTQTTLRHQISTVAQPDGSPALGTTNIGYNAYGNRAYDDNAGMTFDRRDYEYDGRRNVTSVLGKYFTGGVWHDYYVTSAFDARDRRVFKSFHDVTTAKTAQWFFYYDPLDRLTEVRYTPDTSVATTYSVFQLFWLDDRLVLYWQTDYPSVTTSKRYVGTDESNRPVDMICWGTGNCPRVWSINPSAWGFDTNLIGPTLYQPILFAGQYRDTETIAYQNNGLTIHRPGLVLNGFRTYDPFTGSYLQVDPFVDSTWSSYLYVDSNPVGNADRFGLKTNEAVYCSAYSSEYGYGDDWPTLCKMPDTPFLPGGGGGPGGPGGGTQGGGGSPGTPPQTPRPPLPPRPPPPKPEEIPRDDDVIVDKDETINVYPARDPDATDDCWARFSRTIDHCVYECYYPSSKACTIAGIRDEDCKISSQCSSSCFKDNFNPPGIQYECIADW